ncbi:hypothetical protein KSS87_021882, partial [Heliosperma pusillum]
YVKEYTIEESPISLEDILSNVFSDVEVHEKEVYDEGVHVEDGKEDTNAGGKVDGKEVEKDDILVDDYLVDVGGGNEFFDVGAEMVKDDKETKTQKTQEQDHDDLLVTAEDAEAVMAESADLLINAATTGDVVLEDNKDFRSSYLLHSELDEGLMSVVPKTFGCSIDCGEVNEQMVVLSKTMISAKHVFNPMRSLSKQAADYCFLDDCDIPLSNNIVLWGTSSYLTKEDMETMIPDKMIMVGVIEWWSLFLNDTCITVDLSRLFFGLAQMQPLVRICSPTKDEIRRLLKVYWWMKLSPHFLLVKGTTRNNVILILISATTCMKDIIKESDCADFEVRDVKFDWKKKEPNDDESGCFMLYTMTQYEGTEFKSDLGVKVSRRSYCAEIAASLMLADMNQYRNFVLENVKKQELKKPHILSVVSNARKYKVNIPSTNQDAISADEAVPLKVVYKVD